MRAAIVFTILLVIAASVISICSVSAHADALDIGLEAAFDAALVVDARQTVKIPGFCNNRINCHVYETNPLIGSDASPTRVRNYFIATGAMHAVVSYLIPEKYRHYWQGGTLIFELEITEVNKKKCELGWKF